MKSPTAPSSAAIQSMFDRLAHRYDVFNLLTSIGLDTFWRWECLKDTCPGMAVLDLGCGTGDLAIAASKRVGADGRVVGIDFSGPMLRVAESKAKKHSFSSKNLNFLQKKAEELPLPGLMFDRVVSGFVLRNIYENIDTILESVKASLRDGGGIRFLDLTEPPGFLSRAVWWLYMGTLVEGYGRLLFGKDFPSFYLTESARRFLKPEAFMAKLREKGFSRVRVRKFLMGMIVLYEAEKGAAV